MIDSRCSEGSSHAGMQKIGKLWITCERSIHPTCRRLTTSHSSRTGVMNHTIRCLVCSAAVHTGSPKTSWTAICITEAGSRRRFGSMRALDFVWAYSSKLVVGFLGRSDVRNRRCISITQHVQLSVLGGSCFSALLPALKLYIMNEAILVDNDDIRTKFWFV